jgi:CheY-like chemotaxis protein
VSIEFTDRDAHDFARPFQGFQDLMRQRVQDILLVSSLYDSFILSEDGKLHELILDRFLVHNLRHTPGLRHVSSGREALELAKQDEGRYNLIIASMHVGDMSVLDLARKVKEAGLETPVVLLAYDNRELTDFVAENDISDIERAFLWQGDVGILLAIVKYIEDKWNVAHDTGVVGVQAIIVVEDNIRFYSSYLPVIYTELMKQSQNLIPEGINLSHKLMRIRARPKILLCDNFEEAWSYFESYEEEILGVISDIEFPKEGEKDRMAGLELARQVRAKRSDIPVMLQSSFPKNEDLAREIGASFLLKGSPVLLQQLRTFMVENFSFGDFVFHTPDGAEVGRANSLRSLVEMLRTIPVESLAFHGERNHFSNWFKARAEFALAQRLRPRTVSEFETLEHLRQDLIRAIADYRSERVRGMVADFDLDNFDPNAGFSRIGGGSLGGKARGLAFVNRLLAEHQVERMFPGVEIFVPPSVVLGTDVFDRFLEENDLRDFAINCEDDGVIRRRFLAAPFPEDARRDLASFLDLIHYPLAVRSSSLLEDSQYQPFAGVYETYMLPNNHQDAEVRLHQLIDTISRVYASTFSRQAKAYLRGTPYRLEEEKMAVIIQKVIGAIHGDRFYPNFGGVARSHNFYPTAPMKSEDGIAAVALGLGTMVCEGGVCVRFCPKYPRHLVQFSTVQDVLQNSQREFYAIQLDAGDGDPFATDEIELKLHGLEIAEADGTLGALGSTYSPENDAIYDGISRPGVRLVNLAPILKHGMFPLAEILDFLLDIGVQGTRCPVELEFAVNLATGPDERKQFGFLQMRPMPLSEELEDVAVGDVPRVDMVCESPAVLGNGKFTDVSDIVVVDYHHFDRHKSRDVAMTVAQMNGRLVADGLPYILIGVGRWGSTEPYLGIPVTWDQIAGVRVIVEAGFKDFTVTPSQGTHFFQNLTSCGVGYFTVNPEIGQGFVDWDWLAEAKAVNQDDCVRHLRFDRPTVVMMDGKKNCGVILKPGVQPDRNNGE